MAGEDILLVDDDEDLLETLRVVLESEGFQVRCANSGKEGWKEAQNSPPDLAVVDIMMETFGEGVRLTQRFRRNDALKDVPIIVVSAVNQEIPYHLQEETDEGYLPAQKFMDKPVEPEDLIESIRELLD